MAMVLENILIILLLWLRSGSGAAKPGAGVTYPRYSPLYC